MFNIFPKFILSNIFSAVLLLSFWGCGPRVEVVPFQQGNLWVWTPSSNTAFNQQFFTAQAAPTLASSEYSISSYNGRLYIFRDCRKKCGPISDPTALPRCTAEIPITVANPVAFERLGIDSPNIDFVISAVSNLNNCGLNLKPGPARLIYEKNTDGNYRSDRLKLWQPHFDQNAPQNTMMVFAYPPAQY